MYNKVLKNGQINVMNPYNIKTIFSKPKIVMANGEDSLNSEEETENKNKRKDTIKASEEILHEAKEEAKLILDEANLEASKIMEQAKKKADAIVSEARKTGYDEGYKDGEAQGKNYYDDLLNEIEIIRQKASEDYCSMISGAEAEIAELAIDVSRKVVATELKINPEAVIKIVKSTLRRTFEKKGLVVEVSEEDFDDVKKVIDTEIKKELGISEMSLVANPALKAGDCVVETQHGTINGKMDSKLQKIEEAFKEISLQEDEEGDLP